MYLYGKFGITLNVNLVAELGPSLALPPPPSNSLIIAVTLDPA